MPTYEYECKTCGYTFEVFQSISDSPLSDCPQCGKEVRRLINGGAGVIFKGSGFYVNDKNKSAASPKPEGKKDAPPPAAAPSAAPASSAAAPCASCPASASGSCPASDKAAG